MRDGGGRVEGDHDVVAAHPGYGWAGNKGYGSAAHRAALAERGASEQHRRSWNLGLPGAPAQAPPTLFD